MVALNHGGYFAPYSHSPANLPELLPVFTLSSPGQNSRIACEHRVPLHSSTIVSHSSSTVPKLTKRLMSSTYSIHTSPPPQFHTHKAPHVVGAPVGPMQGHELARVVAPCITVLGQWHELNLVHGCMQQGGDPGRESGGVAGLKSPEGTGGKGGLISSTFTSGGKGGTISSTFNPRHYPPPPPPTFEPSHANESREWGLSPLRMAGYAGRVETHTHEP